MVKIVLVGESGSGKDTIQKIICDKYNIPIIKSHTTRLPRSDDEDTYIFSSSFIPDETVFECTKFNDQFYWTTKEDYNSPSWVIIVDPVGVISLKAAFPDCNVVYIKVDKQLRIDRVGEDRANRELNRYNVIPVDYVLDNNGTIDKLLGNIEEMISQWR